jgi:hypothetical protein
MNLNTAMSGSKSETQESKAADARRAGHTVAVIIDPKQQSKHEHAKSAQICVSRSNWLHSRTNLLSRKYPKISGTTKHKPTNQQTNSGQLPTFSFSRYR